VTKAWSNPNRSWVCAVDPRLGALCTLGALDCTVLLAARARLLSEVLVATPRYLMLAHYLQPYVVVTAWGQLPSVQPLKGGHRDCYNDRYDGEFHVPLR
jgi:hypothetical protein